MLATGFGSPTVFDAKGNPCWSCVPEGAPEADPKAGMFTSKPEQSNFKYQGLVYNHFCGLFVVDSGKATVYAGRNVKLNMSKVSSPIRAILNVKNNR
jgi:hypothetical protein